MALFDPSLLTDIDFDKSPVKEKYGLCPSHAGDNLSMRPLNSSDHVKGKL